MSTKRGEEGKGIAGDGMKRCRLMGKKRERLLKEGERKDGSRSKQAMESHGGRGRR